MQIWTYRYLIEVWVEPRSTSELTSIVRARVRDMKHGRDHYIGSIAEFGALVDRQLDDAGIILRRWEREP